MRIDSAERIPIVSNVWLRLRDTQGRVVDEREDHNILVNAGRYAMRNIIGSAFYPASVVAGTNLAGPLNGGPNDDCSVNPARKTYRVRYIGCGVGGVGQVITPPGPGLYTEIATTAKIERPAQVKNPGAPQWLKQVLPQNDVNDEQIFPKLPDNVAGFSIRFLAIFGKAELSFAGQPTYGTNVPISEVGLFTSEAGRDLTPSGSGGDDGKLGFVAYNTFAPISKTPNFTLEVAWSLDF